MMKINKKILIGVFIVSCVVLIGILISLNQSVDKEKKDIVVPEEKQSLQLTIEKAPEKELKIIASFKNVGNETVILAHPNRCIPDSWVKGESYNRSQLIGKSELTCLIILPNGWQISLFNIDEVFNLYGAKGIVNEDGSISDLMSFHLVISPGESKEVTLSKFGHKYAVSFWSLYPSDKDYPFGEPITKSLFPLEGLYKLKIIYKNVFSRASIEEQGIGKIVPVWTGTLTSNTIEIKVPEEVGIWDRGGVDDDWKIYRNEKYGFEFKYPPIPWGCEHCKIYESEEGFNVNQTSLSIEDLKGLTLLEFVNKETESFEIERKEKILIGDKDGIKVDYRLGGRGGFGSAAFVEKNKKVIIFRFTAGVFCCDPKADRIYEMDVYTAMLSTFRFLE